MTVDALLAAAVARLQQGDTAAAGALAREAVALAPAAVAAHTTLATVLLTAGNADAACACYETALALAPDNPEANYGLGLGLHTLGRFEEATACQYRALAGDPDYPEAAYALAASLQAMRRLTEAITQYEAALALAPDFLAARHGLGTALLAAGRPAEAIRCFRAVLAAAPERAETLGQLGRALQSLGQHDAALDCLTRAVQVAPDAGALVRLGTALQEAGRTEAAIDCYERALLADPRHASGYLALFTARPPRPHRFLAAAETLAAAADPPLPAAAQATLHLALGRALSDAGDKARGFDHLLTGNALKRQHIAYDEAATLGAMRRIAAVFTADFLHARAGLGDASMLPVFVVGMPRSGSTLVEQILASHPDVVALGETGALGAALEAVCGGADAPAFPELAPALTATALRTIGTGYIARLQAALPPERAVPPARIIDKRLENFCLIGLIRLALPQARIIHSGRDAIDTCLSCFGSALADVPFAADLGEIGRYWRGYAALMAHWRRVLPAGVLLDLSYEALVDDLEGQARALLAHCGLDWHPACLRFFDTERPVRTASMTQVRRPLYRSSVGRWRPDAATLAPLLTALAGG